MDVRNIPNRRHAQGIGYQDVVGVTAGQGANPFQVACAGRIARPLVISPETRWRAIVFFDPRVAAHTRFDLRNRGTNQAFEERVIRNNGYPIRSLLVPLEALARFAERVLACGV